MKIAARRVWLHGSVLMSMSFARFCLMMSWYFMVFVVCRKPLLTCLFSIFLLRTVCKCYCQKPVENSIISLFYRTL